MPTRSIWVHSGALGDGDSIVTVRAYLDSTMVMYTVLRNETPAQHA
jgi:hypothetical protein